MNIKIKKLNSNAVTPSYAHDDDSCMDIYATTITENGKFIEYGTGLSFEIPINHTMLIFPRSSISNKDLILANHVGVIDSGYRGEIKMRFRKIGNEIYQVGEKIGQMMVLPIPKINFTETEELSQTGRSDGGFGSTDKK